MGFHGNRDHRRVDAACISRVSGPTSVRVVAKMGPRQLRAASCRSNGQSKRWTKLGSVLECCARGGDQGTYGPALSFRTRSANPVPRSRRAGGSRSQDCRRSRRISVDNRNDRPGDPNVHIDTSAHAVSRYPGELVEHMRSHGRKKVLFGSNHPAWPAKKCLKNFDSLRLDESAGKSFLYDNARHVFSL